MPGPSVGSMTVGVYIDAFNVYYGVKEHLASGPGWRWIDPRALAPRHAQLQDHGAVDLIEGGHCVAGPPVAVALESRALPVRRNVQGLVFATVRKREEKGSDVNVATHLLVDLLERRIDGAIVMSNDSDLALPLRIGRAHLPVGLLNPTKKPLAGALKGDSAEGAGHHWWRRLDQKDVKVQREPPQSGADGSQVSPPVVVRRGVHRLGQQPVQHRDLRE